MSSILMRSIGVCVFMFGAWSCDAPAVTGSDIEVVFDPCNPLRRGCPCSLPKDAGKCCIGELEGLSCQGGFWTSFEGCPCRRDTSVSCDEKFVYCRGAPY